jgi:hypothetical protein
VQVQSVIQPANQQSVIQATGGVSLSKNVILVNKLGQGSVIQSTDNSDGSVQLISADELDNIEDESKKRREVLARRPSYRKILNDLSAADISAIASIQSEIKGEGSDDQDGPTINVGGQYLKVLPASSLQLAGSQDGLQGLQTLTMTNSSGAGATGAIVQYATQGQDGQFFVPVSAYSNGGQHHFASSPVTVSAADLQAYQIRTSGSNSGMQQSVVMTSSGNQLQQHHVPEEASKKRELRLLKNREAAKECRRKKKEYIKCLENRVAVLENQNKALIEELKSLKELYCQKAD